jgi:hypothetical protein
VQIYTKSCLPNIIGTADLLSKLSCNLFFVYISVYQEQSTLLFLLFFPRPCQAFLFTGSQGLYSIPALGRVFWHPLHFLILWIKVSSPGFCWEFLFRTLSTLVTLTNCLRTVISAALIHWYPLTRVQHMLLCSNIGLLTALWNFSSMSSFPCFPKLLDITSL